MIDPGYQPFNQTTTQAEMVIKPPPPPPRPKSEAEIHRDIKLKKLKLIQKYLSDLEFLITVNPDLLVNETPLQAFNQKLNEMSSLIDLTKVTHLTITPD